MRSPMLFWQCCVAGQQVTTVVPMLITVLYAISDEAHQLWVAGRYGQPLDVVIDTTGGLLGLWLTARWFGEKHE